MFPAHGYSIKRKSFLFQTCIVVIVVVIYLWASNTRGLSQHCLSNIHSKRNRWSLPFIVCLFGCTLILVVYARVPSGSSRKECSNQFSSGTLSLFLCAFCVNVHVFSQFISISKRWTWLFKMNQFWQNVLHRLTIRSCVQIGRVNFK